MRKHRILTDKIAKETINQEILAQNHPACNNIVHRYRRFHQKQSLAEQFAPTHFDGVEPKTQNKIPRFQTVKNIWMKFGDLLDNCPTHHFH